MGPLEKIFDNFTCYLLSQGVTCYVLSGFRNSPLISVHIIIQLSLLLYFSKHIRLRQYHKFPFILRDLRHLYPRVLCQLQAKSKTRAMIGRCKFIVYVVERKLLLKTVCRNVKKRRLYIYIHTSVFISVYL